MRRRRKRRQISIASLKIFEEETSSSEEKEEAFLESGFEVSLGVCVFSKSSSSRDDVDDAFVTDRTGTPSSSSVEEQDEKEEEEEFVVRLSYAFDISNALVRSRLGITNDKENENNEEDKDEEEVLKTMVFTLKEERFTYEQKGNNDNSITLSVDAREMQKILERVPLRVKENTACVFVETMKPREDDTPTKTPNTRDDTTKKYIVDDRVTVVAKHCRCEETGKLKRQFVNPFV
ncbi:unnamed protein product [Bathycoccus prasinos]|mmetsp:Transcript_907/g.3338  ORF Transcript_907/g.3338 Transcript_907/m.3338 type:complete len:234 (-) Transcript_907:1069-1770(-)